MEFECTREEFEAMEEFFFSGSEGKTLDEDALSLVLTVLGLKKGSAIYDNRGKDGFEQALRDSGLCFRTPPADVETSLQDNLEGWEYLVTRKRENLDAVELRYRSREEFIGDLGLFCGYPEEDVAWFARDGKDEWPEWRSRKELKEISVYAFYRPKPEKENIERARERVERNKEVLGEMDERFDTDLGARLREALDSSVDRR
ncbi:MAG: hypothetical protein ABEJ69_01235 [Candidatus Nanohaloarchaea archaeon]